MGIKPLGAAIRYTNHVEESNSRLSNQIQFNNANIMERSVNSTLLSYVSSPVDMNFYYFINFLIKVKWHMVVIVYPLISLFGLVGNIICILVLIKSGLKKPSNVLLTSLCAADSCVLISYINIPFLMSFIPGKRPVYVSAFEFQENVCYILYYLTITIQYFTTYGQNLSASIVSLITVERFIAVFYALHFKSIVTTRRVWIVVFIAYAIWTPYAVYTTSLYSFQYKYVSDWDVNLGVISVNINDVSLYIDRSVVVPLGLYVPFCVVTAGSLLIAFRVKLTIRKRQQIVSSTTKSKAKSSKSTKLLLTVCAVFSITKIPYVLTNLDFFNGQDPIVVGISFIFVLITVLLQTINSSSNFIIYVVMNKKFREIFKTVMTC
ncbi:hypothetical protein Btru_071861 [Bulinus truncatus]|nr:hypothetical protein Btru_071861 [Bulinus truncatus]